MKADRRHELQENTLAHVLSNFPLYLSVYGGRILLVLALCVLTFVLVRYRSQSKTVQFDNARAGLANARAAVLQLQSLGAGFLGNTETAERRRLLLNDATTQLDLATTSADTDVLRAEAAATRGDLYWALANLSDLPGAATQPALALPEKPSDALARSAEAYEEALALGGGEPLVRATAILGLAAIAENKGDFAAATKRYEEVVASDLPDIYKTVAQEKIRLIPVISRPIRFAATTQPVDLGAPIESPSTQPATQPTP